MFKNTRDVLNQIYQPLNEKRIELRTKLAEAFNGLKITDGFYNGHYHRNSAGQYQADSYPIPVISIMGLCDIEIDFDGITVTTKLSKNRIESFNWNNLQDVCFEVYGAEDYLTDYGNNRTIDDIKGKVLSSIEKEFFISFSLSVDSITEKVINLLNTLQQKYFYY
ncbi:hypothetical protein [Treponema pedis]|uniref:Uncharacterized protein n=1 Tax=Treponema pedis TaxID=409322 RepID=A0A7S6WMV1_9SPIR|nr:hypothetical protein [Treponema pedis]QOW59889.1 hypothetical protein IFE08_08435 [Treponema pedis]